MITRVATGTGNDYVTGGYTLSADPTATDPNGTNPASVTLTGPSVTFTQGRTYRVTYNYSGRSLNPRDLTLSVSIGGANQTAGSVTSTGQADPFSGSRSFDYTPTSTAQRQIVLAFSFATANSTVGDDITVTDFAVTCRPAGT